MCLIARAFARAGRAANTPAFLLTDEKIPGVVAGLVVSRRPVRGAPRTSQVQNCGQTSCRSLRTSTQGLRLTRSCAAGSHGSPVSSHLGISTDATPQHGYPQIEPLPTSNEVSPVLSFVIIIGAVDTVDNRYLP